MSDKVVTWAQIEEANKQTKSVDIKGKAYTEVNQRIKAFRMLHPNGRIETNIEKLDDKICLFKASIYDKDGHLLGTGTAYEVQGSTFINKTSYIENAETSAVGRALGMCGFGIDASLASADEVINAINNQNPNKQADIDYRQIYINTCQKNGIDPVQYAKQHNITKQTTDEEYQKAIQAINKQQAINKNKTVQMSDI